jgi:para-nitrobenzyl esterase
MYKSTSSKLIFISFFILVFSSATAFADKADTLQAIVQTQYGKVRGFSEKGVYVWKGISYAKAPVGDLRFRAPQKPESWQGVKDALKYGASAPQENSRLEETGNQNEDCLFLNIWSPSPDAKKRPVMFWIHGGGFIIGTGSSSLYNGAHLAMKGDVVVVTINYRLGPLGFLYFKNTDDNKKGFENNLGIRDQIAALKWVRENIAAFGGDPEHITIFGESAGGTSVETLLASKAAKGLFTGAIAESGPPAIIWNAEIGESVTNLFLKMAHVSKDSLQLLKKLPVDTIKKIEEAMMKYMVDNTNQKVFSPTIDGDILTDDIFKCLKPEQDRNVALMIGTNKDEASVFASKSLHMMPGNAKGLNKYFDEVAKESREKVTKAYANFPRKSGVLDILTDAVFRIPAIRLAECHSMSAPTYMYRFEWNSFALKLAGLKAFHGLEIPFVFGNTEKGIGKILKAIATKKLIERLSNEMQNAWLNFARYSNPNGTGVQTWLPYSITDRATLIFNRKTELVHDPDKQKREAWDGVVYY